jgi:replicative DNA helicase
MASIERPNAVESERELLAACLKGSGPSFSRDDVVKEVISQLDPDAFAHPHYRVIYTALQAAAHDNSGTIEWGDVRGYISEDYPATRQALQDLVNQVKLPPVSGKWAERNIAKVLKMYKSRRIEQAIMSVRTKALAGEGDEAYNDLVEAVFAIGRERFAQGAQPLSYYAPEVHKEIKERRNQDGVVGLRTGLKPFDEYMGGLQKKKLYYVGGRPGMRKSVVIGQIAYTVAEQGYTVLLASPEMAAEEYTMRLACKIAGMDYKLYNKGTYDDKQEKALHEIVDRLSNRNIIINEGGLQSTHTLRQDIIRFSPDVILLDYAQLFESSRQKGDDYKDLSLFSKELMQMKKDFQKPIVASVQLSRAVEQRPPKDRRPVKSDIRATGQFEQDADGIWMLYHEREYATQDESGLWWLDGKEVDPTTVEFVCAKNRMGEREDCMTYVKPGEMWLYNEPAV